MKLRVYLDGADELRQRLKAIATNTFKPAGKQWADEAARIGRASVPNRNTKYSTGRLHDSIRRKSATARKAVVVAHYTAYFVDAGPKPHSLIARRNRPKGRTLFASRAAVRHPGYRARPFRVKMAHQALRRYPISQKLIDAWNRAA